MSFWNDAVMEKSYGVLQILQRKYEFILIGGWAVYLYTKRAKSKDIDIIVDFETLNKIRRELPLKKNDRQKKYEAKIEGISIDIYLPYYSNLIIAPEEIGNNVRIVDGFNVPVPEILLALKQQAELERSASIKGFKDRVDILSLLELVDLQKYANIVPKTYLDRLKSIVLSAQAEYTYLGYTNPKKIKILRMGIVEKIDEAREKEAEMDM